MSVRNNVTSSRSRQCQYFAVVSKECYAPRLRITVTYVDHQSNIYRLICTNIWVCTCMNFSYRFLRKIRILRKIRTCMDTDFWVWKTQKWWNFHGLVQGYKLMLRIAVTLRSNFLHLVTCSEQHWLHNSVTLHVCTQLQDKWDSETFTCILLNFWWYHWIRW